MPLYRLQHALIQDSALPRDAIVNTFHFDDAGVGSDPEGLCADLASLMQAGWYGGSTRHTVTKAYVVGDPGPPVATHTKNADNAGAFTSSCPREVSLCLSYYAGENRPRRRGRIYLTMTTHGASLGVRPTQPLMAQANELGNGLAGIGGADVDWVLYSPTESAHFDVTNTWVDDEWDTIRTRGLRPTARETNAPGS